jgi:hypothetical protein
VRKNGANIANSASVSGTPAKHGSINGHNVLTVNFVFSLAANDYIQFCWTTKDGTSSIITYPASVVAPIHPASPAVILTVIQIA